MGMLKLSYRKHFIYMNQNAEIKNYNFRLKASSILSKYLEKNTIIISRGEKIMEF
jgi:hypothetical protein